MALPGRARPGWLCTRMAIRDPLLAAQLPLLPRWPLPPSLPLLNCLLLRIPIGTGSSCCAGSCRCLRPCCCCRSLRACWQWHCCEYLHLTSGNCPAAGLGGRGDGQRRRQEGFCLKVPPAGLNCNRFPAQKRHGSGGSRVWGLPVNCCPPLSPGWGGGGGAKLDRPSCSLGSRQACLYQLPLDRRCR